MKRAALLICFISLSAQAQASTQCAQLKEELKAMRLAQQKIMQSLVNNHESFASSLEEYSTVMKTAHGVSNNAVPSQMENSAQAFRNRGLQGKKMAAKLDEATGDLLERVSACLH